MFCESKVLLFKIWERIVACCTLQTRPRWSTLIDFPCFVSMKRPVCSKLFLNFVYNINRVLSSDGKWGSCKKTSETLESKFWKKDLEASAIFERSKVATRFWKFRCMQHDPWNPLREKKKHVKWTHSLFLGSYPKFRDSFGSVDENFNVNEFFKKIISRSTTPLVVSPMIITRDKKTEKMLK